VIVISLEGVQVLLAAGRLRGTWVLRLREEVEGSEMSIGSMTTGDLAAMVAGLAHGTAGATPARQE